MNNAYPLDSTCNVINLISIIFNLIQIARMKCNNITSMNIDAPITCNKRINQPLLTLITIYIIESAAIVKKSL